jgi:hypothetical protein
MSSDSETPRHAPVPLERDDAADEEALHELELERQEDAAAATAPIDPAAVAAAAAALGAAQGPPVGLPPQNVMLHGYRELDEADAARLRRMKDFALALWLELHDADGTPAEDHYNFESRFLGVATLRLEECLLMAEKHFNV